MATKTIRPWQGTTLGIFASIEVAADLLFGLFVLIKGPALLEMLAPVFTEIQAQFPNFDPTLITPQIINYVGLGLFLGAAISFLFARALFKGQRWVTILLTYLYAFTGIIIIWDIFSSGIYTQTSDFVGLGIIAFFFWLALSSLQHPFYKKPAKKK